MKIQAVKGTRDFYPDEMRLRNWIVETWRRVSLRNGFEEYDAPLFEYLDLFTIKSGPEIAEQLFRFEDRGGRSLAIRPEITPSLARLVNARINSLPRPIKWFSVPRLCRAENPQKGRLREFFQWNIDVIGEDSVLADAECVFAAVDGLRELGLSEEDVKVRYSSRALLGEVLRGFGIAEGQIPSVLAVLDKRNKVPADVFEKLFAEAVPDGKARAGALRFLNVPAIDGDEAESVARDVGLKITQPILEALGQLRVFRGQLEALGIDGWCVYDPGIVRGLAYYTGIVYEVFDCGQSLRAIAGGGRYDNLLEVLGGPKIGATGFGMGDVVLGILLAEKGKLPSLRDGLEFFVVEGEGGSIEGVLRATSVLRSSGFSADFSYKRQPLGKQLKEANRRGAGSAVIVLSDRVAVKDLASGNQREVPTADFLRDPRRFVARE